jgi:hypothetical protein
MAYTFGQGGNVVVGVGDTITVCVTNWSSTYDNGVQDLTTTCSEGFQDLGYGIKSAEVTFSGFYDPADQILTILTSVAQPTAMQFNLGNSGSSISSNWLFKSWKVNNPAKEYITFEATVGSTGEITVTQ